MSDYRKLNPVIDEIIGDVSGDKLVTLTKDVEQELRRPKAFQRTNYFVPTVVNPPMNAWTYDAWHEIEVEENNFLGVYVKALVTTIGTTETTEIGFDYTDQPYSSTPVMISIGDNSYNDWAYTSGVPHRYDSYHIAGLFMFPVIVPGTLQFRLGYRMNGTVGTQSTISNRNLDVIIF